MLHLTNSTLRTVIILPHTRTTSVFVSDMRKDARFKIIGAFTTLGEAYAKTEAERPDLTITSSDLARCPEFPMFDAMLRMVGSTRISVTASVTVTNLARDLKLNPIEGPDCQPTLREPHRIVAVGASTGGIEALSHVLSDYPADCPPTVIVQHIKPDYLAGVVARIGRICPAHVVAATNDLPLSPGQVVFAPGIPMHMIVSPNGKRVQLIDAPPMSGHRPSVDVLFQSVAALKHRAVGVLLTGMGRDGATGMGAMRRAGAWTIAQDAETCTVHGMPRVAAEEGAVRDILPLSKISQAILTAASNRQKAEA